MNRIEISNKAYINAEELILRYKNATKVLKKKRDKNNITDEFTLAINGLILLMSELDRNRILDLLYRFKMIKPMQKSIIRIQNGMATA